MTKFTIRQGRKEDCQELRRLIQELADFEKMPNGPKISAEDLQRDGFDTPTPLFQTYVAERDDRPGVLVGYALYYDSYGTYTGRKIYLEDICVTESHRGAGVGKALIRKVIEKAVELNCLELDFAVLDWNPARNFYVKLGASDVTESEGWRFFRIKRPEMVALLSRA